MANEMYVLFRGPLPKMAVLARAFKDLDFPVTIPKPTGSLERQKGFLPMRLHREEAGVELDLFDGHDAVKEIAGPHAGEIDPAFDRVASFRWGGSEEEMVCATCGSAALATLVSGVVLDESGAAPMSADSAIAVAREALASAKPPDRRLGTSPAHIKRYLKSLLNRRSDLVLVGRYLLIRPVRHILRGALLDRTSNTYHLRLWRHLTSLYRPVRQYNDYVHDHAWRVWQPHFEALLMDSLAQDVFARVGPITTLQDFAVATAGQPVVSAEALLLAGKRDLAEALVREVDPDYVYEIESIRRLLARDIESICAEAHAAEKRTAEKLKLTDVWEPAPFPVELPVGGRAPPTEPAFPLAPWIERPAWLLQDLPGIPGEIRFAKDYLNRGATWLLVAPISREEAEIRHQGHESYVAAARLPDGFVALLKHLHGDRLDPDEGNYRRLVDLSLRILGSEHLVFATFFQESDTELELSFIYVLDGVTNSTVWSVRFSRAENEVEIYDKRAEQAADPATRALAEVDQQLITCPIPIFGDLDGLVSRVRRLLHRLDCEVR